MGLVVKDSMVLIHLAKLTLLETSCGHFGKVYIPEMVFDETVKAGKTKGYSDAYLIEEMVRQNKMTIRKISNRGLLDKANQFNIFGGEAEALAVYWQEEADYLASDDDNVRSKKDVLNLSLIGTPAIIFCLFQSKAITREKAVQSIERLRKIGWFHSEVLDRVLKKVGA